MSEAIPKTENVDPPMSRVAPQRPGPIPPKSRKELS